MKKFFKQFFCGHVVSPEFRLDHERKKLYKYCKKCGKKFWID